jgi:hypothetical protein
MIHGEAALPHHLLQVTVRELVSAIPSDTKKDNRGLKVPLIGRGLRLLHEDDF